MNSMIFSSLPLKLNLWFFLNPTFTHSVFQAGFTTAQILAIVKLTMHQLPILHCMFRFCNMHKL